MANGGCGFMWRIARNPSEDGTGSEDDQGEH